MAWALAIGVNEAIAQNHEAPAFAIDERPWPPVSPLRKSDCGERAAMQLRIAAGQENGIGVRVGRLVRQRRERHDLGAGLAPVMEEVRIGEREGRSCGDRDALAQRRQDCDESLIRQVLARIWLTICQDLFHVQRLKRHVE